jgi:hypothetical protein
MSKGFSARSETGKLEMKFYMVVYTLTTAVSAKNVKGLLRGLLSCVEPLTSALAGETCRGQQAERGWL